MMKRKLFTMLVTVVLLFTLTAAAVAEPAVWTAEQKATLDSVRKLDENGYIYEMNYTADYKLDEVIAAGTYPNDVGAESIRKTILPESTSPSPKNVSVGGCSTFSVTAPDGHALLARNYDWFTINSASLVIHTAPADGYKSVGVTDVSYYGVHLNEELTDEALEGLLYAPYCVLEGVNEKGLSVGLMNMHGNVMKQETGKQQLATNLVIRVLLDRAANVDEAIEIMKSYDIVSAGYDQGMSYHWLVADAEGRRVVLEYVNDELQINECPLEVQFDVNAGAATVAYPGEKTDYLLSTNFATTEGAQDPTVLGDNGYGRYETLLGKLKEDAHPTKEIAMTYLEAIRYSQDRDTLAQYVREGVDPESIEIELCASIDSSVYDLAEKTLDICVHENYDTVRTFGIDYVK